MLSYEDMLNRFIKSPISRKFAINDPTFISRMLNAMNQYKHVGSKTSITKQDIKISEQTLGHLKKFFTRKTLSKTRRRRTQSKRKQRNKTRKKY